MDYCYSITAYNVELKKREKGINGKSLSELLDYSSIIDNPKELIKQVFDNIKSTNYLSSNILFKHVKIDKSAFKEFEKFFIKLEYGSKTEIDFSVHHNETESKFSKGDKIIKPYIVYFFVNKSKIYFVAFRNGFNSCKTALEKQFKQALSNTNVIVNFNPIVNEEYIQERLGEANINNVQFETIYKIDDGDTSTERKKERERYSTVCIDMTNNKNKIKFRIGKFIEFITGKAKENVISKAKETIENENDIEIDENSFKMEIQLNGVKRIVSFEAFNSMLYDIDISDDIKLLKNGEIDISSLNNVVENYMEGIIENDI